MVVLDCWRQNPRCVRQAKMTLGWLLEELSPQAAHRPTTEFTSDFYPWQIQPKMGNRNSKNRNKGVSESQSLTNTPARFMYNTYRAHTCKYLVNWRNYTARDLNLKWPKWDSFDIPKLVFLHAQLKKANHASLDWYLETSKWGNDRVTSSQEANKKFLETISELKRLLTLTLPGCRSSGTGKSCSACLPLGFWFLGITLPSFWGIIASWLLISGHLFAFCFICSMTPVWWSSGSVWHC